MASQENSLLVITYMACNWIYTKDASVGFNARPLGWTLQPECYCTLITRAMQHSDHTQGMQHSEIVTTAPCDGTTLFCTMLYCSKLYGANIMLYLLLCYVASYVVVCCAVLCCAILCCVVLCCTMLLLCNAVLGYPMYVQCCAVQYIHSFTMML